MGPHISGALPIRTDRWTPPKGSQTVGPKERGPDCGSAGAVTFAIVPQPEARKISVSPRNEDRG
jgi:hypothetical protein